MNLAALIFEIFLVLGIPFLVFGAAYLSWRYWGRDSSSKFVRNITTFFMGASGLFVVVIGTFLYLLAKGGMSSTGGRGYEKSEVVCMKAVQQVMPKCNVYVLQQDIKKIAHNDDEASAWSVAVLCKPNEPEIPVPLHLEIGKGTFLQTQNKMFRRCQYVFSCEARDKKNGGWSSSISQMDLDMNSVSIRNEGPEYCRDIEP